MQLIDNFLDKITMYRLVLYYLLFLISAAAVFGLFGVIPYSFFSIIISASVFVAACWMSNKIFSWAYDAPTNFESVYITALILALIISPMKSFADLPFVLWASVLAMASKYILAIDKKHIFNPAAIAVVLTSLGFGASASWWIGTGALLPFSLIGFLIVRKIRSGDLVFYFFLAAVFTIAGFTVYQGGDLFTTFKQTVNASPIFFFAFVMLTEPLTAPPTILLQSFYGILVGIFFAPQFHLLSFYATPEQALIIGNVFAYFVSPKYKIIATINQRVPYGSDIVDFIFPLKNKLLFTPGQYMEWTLPHKNPDSRGNRRYFTIASSPTENSLRLGIKFYPNGSTYKKALLGNVGTSIIGAQLRGDFTLPKDPKEKLVFIAGGIGITPFRSMLKYLVDTSTLRNIVLLYSNKTIDEIMYADVFTQSRNQLGIQTVYTLTDTAKIPPGWQGERGRIDTAMIMREIPDYKERIFYLSGPHAMVRAYEETLQTMHIPKKQIKIDFFPGFV